MKKRIFYFNVTYSCNSNCVFCYSHNTWHNSRPHNEIEKEELFVYLNKHNVGENDRVIINGGEPLLHKEIETILLGLISYNCEVLVYTNGRLLVNHDFSMLTDKFRFVIPIHGYETIHDNITGVQGSYQETIQGLKYLVENSICKVDVKLILNNEIIANDPKGLKTIEGFEQNVVFNNAIHLTKMANTVISLKNNCKPISNDTAAYYLNIFYEYFKKRNFLIKIFDTCVYALDEIKNREMVPIQKEITVYFKDKNMFKILELTRPHQKCMDNCPYFDKCKSAVDEYTVLEIHNNNIYENLE